MKVLITGANGFVGKNLTVHLGERQDVEVFVFPGKMTPRSWLHWWHRLILYFTWQV